MSTSLPGSAGSGRIDNPAGRLCTDPPAPALSEPGAGFERVGLEAVDEVRVNLPLLPSPKKMFFFFNIIFPHG